MNAPVVPQPDRAAILEALSALFDTDDVIEVRAFHKGRKRTDAGYFDGEHREDLADAAVRLNAAGAAVYVTLNRIDSQLLGRYCNRVEQYAQATVTDANVTRRRWLLIDFDPVRPKDTAATDTQLAAALKRGRECCQALQGEGWPDPIECESGNGMHLLYPLDLPNDTESRDLVKGALAGLAIRFDDDAVKVDQSVFNAGRIVKLYGTTATKGDHTLLAPWRLSRITWSLAGEPVTPDQLLALHPKGNGIDSISVDLGGFNLPSFLSRLGVPYDQDIHEGRERYKLAYCPFNSDHGKGEAAVFRAVSGQLGFKCMHSSCADKTWQHVRALVDGPPESRRASAGPQGMHEQGPGPENAPAGGQVVFRCLADVQARPISWLWPGRIARGKITMLAGHPGLGKSQVTISMAAIVTAGGQWPVDRTTCERGSVIILSAEDDAEDTIRPRLEAADADLRRVYTLDAIRETGKDGAKAERGFNLATDVERLGDLARELRDVALIVIDPVTAYLGGVDSHKNAEVRGLLAPLAAIAAEHTAAVVCVSHLTKAGGTEAMLRVMGSLGFVAASRAAYLVAKDPNDDRRRLFLPMKNNIAEDTGGLAFRVMGRDLGGGIKTSCVEWDAERVTMTADEAMAVQGGQEERDALSDAKAFLERLLVDGPVPSKQIRADANGAGYAWPTILRAQKAAGITAVKEGGHFGGGKQQWIWQKPFPQDDQGHAEDAQKTNVDHLQANVSPKPFSGAPFAEDDQDICSEHLQPPSGGDPGVVEVEII